MDYICEDILEIEVKKIIDMELIKSFFYNDDYLNSKEVEGNIIAIISFLEKLKKWEIRKLNKDYENKEYFEIKISTYNKQIELLNKLLKNTNFEDLLSEECYNIYKKSVEIRTTVFDECGNKLDVYDIESFSLASKVGISYNKKDEKTIDLMKLKLLETNDISLLLQAKFLVDRLQILNELDENINKISNMKVLKKDESVVYGGKHGKRR